ncbi:MAG TPA: hypothetical protein RMH85_08525 [Polyangiaceae bacterium LLY-WYZ-15_(1-7)]|nr:hypothetical protein [Myxococcales bacterium]MAT26872.1 hypothetical protein [Sandaracinus sp.]HJK90329.1 hypothetical protein [Polyangiaceae bacterium LLY-WYZ-15_(1-7)]MBJ72095.1 hypothetical protein [Sandaracinus sp.]HJL04511.1 hypothetical protein [Polyangiaceae bacterium LLY-WYZ-15_(1-7)]
MERALIGFVAIVAAGCFEHHVVLTAAPRDADAGVERDAGVGVERDAGSAVDAGACDLSAVECTALPGCLGENPPETMYCDDVRICLASDPGGEVAAAIEAVAERVRCDRADSCDFLCGVVDGGFDDEVRAELCAIARVAPAATIECAIYGP